MTIHWNTTNCNLPSVWFWCSLLSSCCWSFSDVWMFLCTSLNCSTSTWIAVNSAYCTLKRTQVKFTDICKMKGDVSSSCLVISFVSYLFPMGWGKSAVMTAVCLSVCLSVCPTPDSKSWNWRAQKAENWQEWCAWQKWSVTPSSNQKVKGQGH